MPRLVLCAIAAVLIGPSDVSAAHADVNAVPRTPFVSAVLRSWAAWDSNGDGTLSPDEVDRAVRDPAVKGDAAAAAAAIKLLSRSNKVKLPALTREYFLQVDEQVPAAPGESAAAEKATIDTLGPDASAAPPTHPGSEPDWQKYFAASRVRIARGGRGPVWQPSNMAIDHIQQGPLGDCFFVATVGSIVTHRPELLRSMVIPTAGGSYTVTFSGAAPIVVPPITDAERAISSTTPDDGAWLAVMEQAFGKYRSVRKGGPADVDGTEILRKGGDSGPTIMELTGHRYRRISFGKTIEIRERDESTVLSDVRKALVENIQHHRIITAGVNPPTQDGYARSVRAAAEKDGTPTGDIGTVPQPPAGVQKNHVYTVVAFDPDTDRVTIWNPHGQTWQPTGTPGLVNGYPTVHGLFTLPLRDAYRFYTSFTFETDQPAASAAIN